MKPSTEPCLPELDGLKLVRDGTAQGDRFPAPLDPASIPILGRAPEHAMIFARDFARHLRYYDATNTPVDDWRPFFDGDVSVLLAVAAVQDVARYRRAILACIQALEDLDNKNAPDVVRRYFGFIFGAVGTLALRIDALAHALPSDITLKATVGNLVASRLREPLEQLVAWFNADQARPAGMRLVLPDLVPPDPPDDFQLSILGAEPASFHELLKADKLPTFWSDAEWGKVKTTALDASVFGATNGTVFQLANSCAGNNLFTGACDRFLRAYARIAADARVELKATMTAYDKHDPHYALFLTFLSLFEDARADVNALGGRHLDFYYREVLQLAERKAQPASAHLVVELAKNVASYEIEAKTLFKAGKDAKKTPIAFASDEALVANKAAVTSIASLYRDGDADAIRVDAAARTEGSSWHPFESDAAIGSFGFATASHYLRLAEGTRTIALRATVSGFGGTVGASLIDAFTCRVTTEKGWLDLVPTSCSFTAATTFEIKVTVGGDQPAVVDYNPGKHGLGYGAIAAPILEVRLGAIEGMLSTFVALEPVKVTTIALDVDVAGFRSLVVSTDLGPADTSKPFQPFGAAPVIGSSFLLGCQEAFSKASLGTALLSLVWRNPDWRYDTTHTKADVLRLSGGAWSGAGETLPFQANPQVLDLVAACTGFNPDDDPSVSFVAPYSLAASSGYVKLVLQGTFGHADYAADVAQWVINSVTGATPATPAKESVELLVGDEVVHQIVEKYYQSFGANMPSAPYTPELESITLSYTASQSIDLTAAAAATFDARRARFYHVTPLGAAEQHANLRAESEDTAVSLVPLVRHLNALDPVPPAGAPVPHEGEMYVGLSGVVAPQNVALLFQVEDGSADPLAEKPSPHLHFSYLRSGDWVAFEADAVDDRTSALLESGIITFSVPEDATTDDTLLPGGLTWIRIAVGSVPQAVCRLFDVKAQALRSTFQDAGNDTSFLASPLAAGTIAKLVTPVASVKSVAQPYETFGGRLAETSDAFRTRVSERLRHKDRAIALWDVERLVLQAFPEVHRVKCLDHTRYTPSDTGAGVYRELAGGHVTVVTIPAVSEGYAGDPLTPYTSLGVLTSIGRFLTERMSCFATVWPANPAYERLRLSCRVRLRDGSDTSYCLAQLRECVTRFLAPWAYDAAARPSFGGRVYRASLINLLEEQACVDYLTDVRLFVTVDDAPEVEAGEFVEGTRAVSVLASVPADDHDLTAIDAAAEEEAGEICGCAP